MTGHRAFANAVWDRSGPLVLSALIATSACGTVERARTGNAIPSAATGGSTTMHLDQGTQGRFGTLSIGVVSIGRETGLLEAQLSVSTSEPLATHAAYAVHVGETVVHSGYSLFVRAIALGSALDSLGCIGRVGCSSGASVVLEVSRASN